MNQGIFSGVRRTIVHQRYLSSSCKIQADKKKQGREEARNVITLPLQEIIHTGKKRKLNKTGV
jgi:hypothetical protein